MVIEVLKKSITKWSEFKNNNLAGFRILKSNLITAKQSMTIKSIDNL